MQARISHRPKRHPISLFFLLLIVIGLSVCPPAARANDLLMAMAGKESGPGVYRLTGGSPKRLFGTPANAPVEMAINADAGIVYWIEGGSRFDVGSVLRSARLDGTDAITVIRADEVDAEAFTDIAYHDGSLYLIDFDTKFSQQPPRILRIGAEGGRPVVLVERDLSKPIALAVAPTALLWADGTRILRTDLDGSRRTVLYESEYRIQDVAIDGNQVYWIARAGAGDAELGQVSLDGTGVQIRMRGEYGSDLAGATDLDVHGERVVWFSERSFEEDVVVEARLDASSRRVITPSRHQYDGFTTGVSPKIKDVALADGFLYVTDRASHNIVRRNLQDGHVDLLLTPPIYGINALTSMGETGTIYWADPRTGINRAAADGSAPTIILPQAAQFHVTDIEPAPEREFIYWSSPDGGIVRATLDGSTLEVVVSAGGEQNIMPSDIALDSTNERIYWMNEDARVMRATMDGNEVEELISGLAAPGPIAVDPANHALYWVDRGSFSNEPPPQMVRAGLDGSNPETLPAPVSVVTTDLLVDTDAGLLYWDNIDRAAVFQARLDGTDAKPIVRVENVVRALALAFSNTR